MFTEWGIVWGVHRKKCLLCEVCGVLGVFTAWGVCFMGCLLYGMFTFSGV